MRRKIFYPVKINKYKIVWSIFIFNLYCNIWERVIEITITFGGVKRKTKWFRWPMWLNQNDNLFQYINIMRGSRNFSQEFSRDMGVQIPFPAPPFNKSMQERIQIIMHKNRLPTIANWLRDQRVHHNAS